MSSLMGGGSLGEFFVSNLFIRPPPLSISRNTKLSLEKKERGERGGRRREEERREERADYAFDSTSHDQKIVVLDFSSGLGVDPGLIV